MYCKSIEIIGIPGSGKSTNFKNIKDDLIKSGIKAVTKDDLIHRFIYTKYKNIFFRKSKTLSSFIFRLRGYAHKLKYDFMISEQQFIQKILTINTIRDISEKEKKYLFDLLLESIYIYWIGKDLL